MFRRLSDSPPSSYEDFRLGFGFNPQLNDHRVVYLGVSHNDLVVGGMFMKLGQGCGNPLMLSR